jgi:hypothetical protein
MEKMMESAMKIKWVTAFAAVGLAGMATAGSTPPNPATLEAMPAKLETQFALSAVPPAMRDQASVYLLDPKQGYALSKQGTSGVTCIVQRTEWAMAEYRNDIYYPVCYDAAGTRSYLKFTMDAAALRAQGMSAAALKAEIQKRYREKTYQAPEKAGVSYMVGPIMRTIGPPDLKVHTMAMPHLMFYAPNVTNQDLGAVPDLNDPSSLIYPFMDEHTESSGEENYIIQLMGETEKAKIVAAEKPLLDELCAYRDVLCLNHSAHSKE